MQNVVSFIYVIYIIPKRMWRDKEHFAFLAY